jgi:hypothetical protein
MPLAILGLVCLEARVKFKNIDFQTEADFACYCSILGAVDELYTPVGHQQAVFVSRPDRLTQVFDTRFATAP